MPSINLEINGTTANILCDPQGAVDWDNVGFADPLLANLKATYERDKDNIIIIPDPVPVPPVVEVREIDSRRLRLALLQLGQLDIVEQAINSLGRVAQIEWEYATVIKEDNPLTVALSERLKLDTNAIFELANSFV